MTAKHQKWSEVRDAEDDRLYEKYGKPLEKDHRGELVAIGSDGTVLFADGRISGKLVKEAIERFGTGNWRGR